MIHRFSSMGEIFGPIHSANCPIHSLCLEKHLLPMKPIAVLLTALRLQLIVVLYAAVSMCSKWAARCMEAPRTDLPAMSVGGVHFDFRVPAIVALMFCLLAVYAWLWQIIIAKMPISVAYANKSAYLVWTQLGAVFLFGETVSPGNWVGLAIVLAGVLLVNGGGRHD